MSRRVAVVEDEAELASLLEYNLTNHGFQSRLIGGTKGTLAELEEWRPDLIVLDVMLPDGDGFDLCRQIRKSSTIGRTPILFLTARSDEVDRVLGLEIGGDDYITKPFSPRELIARVKAHLRRGESDQEAHRVFLVDKELQLTSTEFRLLDYFLMNPGKAYSREQLLSEVWGQQHYVTPRTVDVHIRRLREQIEEHPDDPKFLVTVRGFGYRFESAA
jgi:two-component system phosphate regulon response regulator PhoB